MACVRVFLTGIEAVEVVSERYIIVFFSYDEAPELNIRRYLATFDRVGGKGFYDRITYSARCPILLAKDLYWQPVLAVSP